MGFCANILRLRCQIPIRDSDFYNAALSGAYNGLGFAEISRHLGLCIVALKVCAAIGCSHDDSILRAYTYAVLLHRFDLAAFVCIAHPKVHHLTRMAGRLLSFESQLRLPTCSHKGIAADLLSRCIVGYCTYLAAPEASV